MLTTAAALVSELIEACDEKHLQRFQKQLAAFELLIVVELGYVPLSKTGAELLFETFSQRYERASTLVTSNLPFDEWTEVFGSERLTGALLDRLVHLAYANNANNYYEQSVGFSLKFMIDPIPTSTDLQVNSIPDWTGKQPFSVR